MISPGGISWDGQHGLVGDWGKNQFTRCIKFLFATANLSLSVICLSVWMSLCRPPYRILLSVVCRSLWNVITSQLNSPRWLNSDQGNGTYRCYQPLFSGSLGKNGKLKSLSLLNRDLTILDSGQFFVFVRPISTNEEEPDDSKPLFSQNRPEYIKTVDISWNIEEETNNRLCLIIKWPFNYL